MKRGLLKRINGLSKQNHHKRLATLAFVATCLPLVSMAETRGFVVYYFHTATHGDPRNCPDGDNGDYGDIKLMAFKLHGYEQARINEILSGQAGAAAGAITQITTTRGRRNSEPANIFLYPTSAPDPKLKRVVGPYAYGFDLDGKGAQAPKAFEDPETGNKGVDNEFYRVVGCFRSYNESLPTRPFWEEQTWSIMSSKMPAWIFSITGEDLSRDGEVTVSFRKAIGPRRQNATGDSLFNATYIVDPNPRYQGEFRGVIKDGVFTSEPGNVKVLLTGNPREASAAKMELSKAQLRLTLNADGTAKGYMGGYQPWLDFWFMLGQGNEVNTLNSVGLYYGLRDLADADPDPRTGQNRAISSTFRIEAVPAFLARSDGALITSPQLAAQE